MSYKNLNGSPKQSERAADTRGSLSGEKSHDGGVPVSGSMVCRQSSTESDKCESPVQALNDDDTRVEAHAHAAKKPVASGYAGAAGNGFPTLQDQREYWLRKEQEWVGCNGGENDHLFTTNEDEYYE